MSFIWLVITNFWGHSILNEARSSMVTKMISLKHPQKASITQKYYFFKKLTRNFKKLEHNVKLCIGSTLSRPGRAADSSIQILRGLQLYFLIWKWLQSCLYSRFHGFGGISSSTLLFWILLTELHLREVNRSTFF